MDLAAASTTGLNNWIKANVVQIACVIAGLIIVFRAKAKDWAGSLVTLSVVLLGLGVMAMGAGNNAQNIGGWLLGLIWS
ncbi:hypothetical protein [Streptantibioticus ferralitis]|uniref:Uncharacterized protein n=1 Tax=Streptantibioticus ferralitis TaxID=236510 RepID=A0ABT5ZBD1_9ACTN|nr:hypothetical protein [Streptantibioticus ferralitis]MDF2260942.1 hypothetical protein [Streptantibioticus ferralitis]